MFTAISSLTGEQVASVLVDHDPLYTEIKKGDFYADPINIRRYDKEKVPDINKILVTYIAEKKYYRTDGNEIFVTPYFMIPNRTALGIDVIPESEEHKIAKSFIYNELIKNERLQFSFAYNEKITRIPQTAFGIKNNTISVEETFRKPHRRADVHAGFDQYYPLLGTGLIIEIQFSKQSDEHEWRRTQDHASRGYSVAWLRFNDFEIDNYGIKLKKESISFIPNAHIIAEMTRRNQDDMRAAVRKVWEDVHAAKSRLMLEIQQATELPEYGGHCGYCWKEHGGVLQKKFSYKKGTIYWGCSRFPQCAWQQDKPGSSGGTK